MSGLPKFMQKNLDSLHNLGIMEYRCPECGRLMYKRKDDVAVCRKCRIEIGFDEYEDVALEMYESYNGLDDDDDDDDY